MTNWFEPLYRAAERGEAEIPWDRGAPQKLIEAWARGRDGAGRRALVVGSGTGDDAEMIAGLEYDTVAFDIAETAVRITRRRFPESRVDYRVANLLDPPAEWAQAFDLVVESITVQSMPVEFRAAAVAGVSGFVAPGGTLVVYSGIRGEGEDVDGPPWPLTRAEVESFATGGVEVVRIERPEVAPGQPRWLAEFRRPSEPARGAGTTRRTGRRPPRRP